MARISARSGTTVANVDQGSAATNEGEFAMAPKIAVSADATSGNNNNTTALADFDLVGNNATNNIAAAFGGTVSYSATTHQYSGTMSASATVTSTMGNAIVTLLNTLGTQILATQTALSGVPVSDDVVIDVNLSTVTSWSRMRKIIDRLSAVLRSTMNP